MKKRQLTIRLGCRGERTTFGKGDNKTYTADAIKTTEITNSEGKKETKREFINAEGLSIGMINFRSKQQLFMVKAQLINQV